MANRTYYSSLKVYAWIVNGSHCVHRMKEINSSQEESRETESDRERKKCRGKGFA